MARELVVPWSRARMYCFIGNSPSVHQGCCVLLPPGLARGQKPKYKPKYKRKYTPNQSVKRADRPDFVTAVALASSCYDSHSSRRRITPALKLPTRTLREPPQRVPIWNCSRWRLPCFTVTEYARLCGPIPRLILRLAPRLSADGR